MFVSSGTQDSVTAAFLSCVRWNNTLLCLCLIFSRYNLLSLMITAWWIDVLINGQFQIFPADQRRWGNSLDTVTVILLSFPLWDWLHLYFKKHGFYVLWFLSSTSDYSFQFSFSLTACQPNSLACSWSLKCFQILAQVIYWNGQQITELNRTPPPCKCMN